MSTASTNVLPWLGTAPLCPKYPRTCRRYRKSATEGAPQRASAVGEAGGGVCEVWNGRVEICGGPLELMDPYDPWLGGAPLPIDPPMAAPIAAPPIAANDPIEPVRPLL